MIIGAGTTSLFIAAVVVLSSVLHSTYSIGPTQIGLVRKRFGAKLPGDNPLAFRGEAGYQAQLLMPGLRFKFGMVFAVTKHPWVQVPAGQIGVVIAQVGQPLPIGAKSAVYKPEFGNFSDLNTFIEKGGQKGVQRPVLSPGTLAPIHPVAFMVITKPEVFGQPISSDLSTLAHKKGALTYEAFGLDARQLEVTRISPHPTEAGKVLDMVGVVTTLEGEPLPAGDIASRLGGFKDIEALESVVGRSRVDVVGPVCESGDFLALDRELEDLRAGDLMAIHSAGAYGYVMSSNYNTRGRPAEVLVDGDRFALVTQRESYEHLVTPELLEPEWRGD